MTKKDTEYHIRYLPNHLVDKQKWDACISSSDLPLVYAKSVYLDEMCRRWDALVLNDYEAVMPLPWNKKWLLAYVYSPYFVIAGGLFGRGISERLLLAFIAAIPQQYRLIDLDLNEHNFFPDALSVEHILCRQRRNTWLSLKHSYEHLFSNYSTGAKRKLKKANSYHFSIDKSKQVKKVIALYKQHYKNQDSVVSRFGFTKMIALLDGKLADQTRTYILSFPDGEVCAFYLLLYDDNFVYWLIGGSTGKGKEAAAFYYLTDAVIRDFSNSNRTFRFEGSDHEGIHFFNSQFGGQTVYYPHIKINRLPWPLRHLK